MPLRVGIDLVAVDSVEHAMAEHEHYLTRVYTERELADCATPGGIAAERLAARFAAKEAALKVLRPSEQGVPWTAIEVRRDPGGWVGLELSGTAAELAANAGVEDLTLSITHENGFAAAVVVASCATENEETIR